MIFMLMIWFILTGNTEMSLFLKEVHSSKGKSKHLDRRRWLFHNSPSTASHNLKHWHLKKNRHKTKLTRINDEIRMPYKIFENGNKYKRLKSKYIKKHKNDAIYPKDMFATLFRKSKRKMPLYQQFHYKHNSLTKRRNNIVPSIENFKAKNVETNDLINHDEIKSNLDTRNAFPFNQMILIDNFNQDDSSTMHLKNERKQFISPFFPGIRTSSKSNNYMTWNEKIQLPSNDYNKLVNHYPRDLQAAAGSPIINKPKYLTLPPYFMSTKADILQDFSTSMKETYIFTSKLTSESGILSEYKQPAANVIISYLTTPSYFELGVPIQNNMPKQDLPRDLPQFSAVSKVINEPKYLSLPSFYKFTKATVFPDFSNSVKEMRFFTSKLSTESKLSPEYKQSVTNRTPPSPTIPFQNNMPKQANLFEDESKTMKPLSNAFPVLNKPISLPSEAFGNPIFQQQPAIFQGQNRVTHKNVFENRPSNVSNAGTYNQSGKKNNLHIKPTYFTTSMTSTEMSAFQHFHHRLKQIKDIHDRLGNRTKILVSLIAAVLVSAILILILGLIYRCHKEKVKRKYPFKKNSVTLLRTTRQEQKELIKTIGHVKYHKLTEEDFEK